MPKIPIHSGKSRKASSSKTNNRGSKQGAHGTVGGLKVKSKPSNPRSQKTQNAKNTSGKVGTKKLKLGQTEQSTKQTPRENAIRPDAMQNAIKKRLFKNSKPRKSTTVKDLRNYLKKKG